MKELGGRPHWAKNFVAAGPEIEKLYGEDISSWRAIRNEVDPEGMFIGEWHRRNVLGDGPRLALEEVEIARRNRKGGGLEIFGVVNNEVVEDDEEELKRPATVSSEESFDMMRASEITN